MLYITIIVHQARETPIPMKIMKTDQHLPVAIVFLVLLINSRICALCISMVSIDLKELKALMASEP